MTRNRDTTRRKMMLSLDSLSRSAVTSSLSPPICVCACAPGKVILFGEHAVVYGEPAMAASLSDLRIWVKITRCHQSQLEVLLPDLANVPSKVVIPALSILNLSSQQPPTVEDADEIRLLLQRLHGDDSSKTAPLSELALSALTPVVYLVHQLASSFLLDGPGSSNKYGLIIQVCSKDLPVGAGLGSSAAFSVALAAALIRLTLWNPPPLVPSANSIINQHHQYGRPNQAQLETINQFAFYSELLLHGTPSGIDNTVSTFGGAIVYTKDAATGKVTTETLSNFPTLNLVLTNTNVPRSTKQLVGHVRNLYQQHPNVVQPMLQAMGAITRQFRDWIVHKSVAVHGADVLTLIETNQHLLRAIGVSHPSLDCICQLVHDELINRNDPSAATSATATTATLAATKLTGAGGGGCAITLVRPGLSPLQTQQVMDKILRKLGSANHTWNLQCLTSRVGGDGVLWLDPSAFPEDSTTLTVNTLRSNSWMLAAAAAVVAVAAMAVTKICKK